MYVVSVMVVVVVDTPSGRDLKRTHATNRRLCSSRNHLVGFDHHYFISKPPNFSLKTPGSNITLGCLLFSHNFFHTFSYNEPNGNSSTTCPFPSDCYKPMLAPILIYRMANSSTGAVATDGPCGSLGNWVERNWLDNPDMNKCTTGRGESLTGWRHAINMTGLEFLGSGAPDTIEEVDKENSRSTDDRCRPTLPKGNQMARLGDDRFIIGNKYGNNILASPKQEGLDGFIPSISVIFHESGERTIRVMCMRIVGNPPYQQGSSGSATGTAVARLGPEMGVLVGAALFAGWAVVHLL